MGMAFCSVFLLAILAFGVMGNEEKNPNISRNDFPPGFVFGAATSAYQVEGAAMEDGRSPSIWDTFTHAGNMPDKSTGDIASDEYHKYKEDVKLMSETGLDAYRLSISWSRLLPYGRGAVNPKGLQYYNNLINELISHGIRPHVTLCHLDLPQVLEDEYGGWLSPKIVEDFKAYADTCFKEFGDRVSHWITINEPNVMAIGAYDSGLLAPKRCSYPFGFCMAGNSSTEPYIAAHNTLLAHAAAVILYKEKYQVKQKGWIGLNIYVFWFTPFTNSIEDVTATQRALDFIIGWCLDPLVFGDYPDVMKKYVGSRLPSFTEHQSRQVKGSFDFLGLNHYTTFSIADEPCDDLRDFINDMCAKIEVDNDDMPSSQFIDGSLPVVPSGLVKVLEYLKQDYGNPPIYIHENGYGMQGLNDTARAEYLNLFLSSPPIYICENGYGMQGLNDTARAEYLNLYLGSLLSAVRNGSDTRGYFVWSFLDVFEFLGGYQSRYGLYYVDFQSKDLTRQPKFSAHWYSNFLNRSNLINKSNLSTKLLSLE